MGEASGRLIFIPGENIFRCKAQTLVNPVNTIGAMGKGLAKQFSIKSVNLLAHYRNACNSGELVLGKPWIYSHSKDKKILCFPTKHAWWNPSKIEWIREGLEYLVQHYEEMGITSIAFPELGCGEGGLKWKDVCPIIVEYASQLPMDVYILGPDTRQGQK